MADDSQILWVGGEFIEMAQGPLSLREKWTDKRNAAMKKEQVNSEVGEFLHLLKNTDPRYFLY